MNRTTRNVCIDPDVAADIEHNPETSNNKFSSKVNEWYRDTYLGIKSLKEREIIALSVVQKIREAIEIKNSYLKKEEFKGFCPICAEPMREIKFLSKDLLFPLCSSCHKARLDEAYEIFKKIKKEVFK